MVVFWLRHFQLVGISSPDLLLPSSTTASTDKQLYSYGTNRMPIQPVRQDVAQVAAPVPTPKNLIIKIGAAVVALTARQESLIVKPTPNEFLLRSEMADAVKQINRSSSKTFD